mgnify:CR=1 FL=1|jgi:hypothetical protein
MLNPNELLANHTMELIPFLQNFAVGVSGLFVVMWFNIFFLRRIVVYYEINARIHLIKDQFNRVFLTYVLAITFLMLVQVLSIFVWGAYIRILGLIDTTYHALLFAGSCYTTIGIISDVMPNTWKVQAIFIALSGLFGLALSTASMLNMAPLFRKAWYRKHDKAIRAIMHKANLPIQELDELEGNLTPADRDR